MRIILGILFSCLFTTELFSQFSPSYADFETRKGNITLKVGMEYRVTPFYKGDEMMQRSLAGSFTNVDNLNRGEAFSYGLEMFFSRKLSFNLEHSLRRSVVILPFGTVEGDFGINTAEKELLMGFHGFFDYHIQVFPKSELFFRLGFSTYNGGSNFVVKSTSFNQQDEIVNQAEFQGSFDNEGLNLGIGYAKNQFKVLIGMYSSRGNVYYSRTFPIYTPYLKLSYNLVNL